MDKVAEYWCNDCERKWPYFCFAKSKDLRLLAGNRRRKGRRSLCKRCEVKRRTEQKDQDRLMAKAIRAIRRHALKFGKSVKEFCREFDWSAKQLAHDYGHAMKNGCPYCNWPFATMPGFADLSCLTVDVIDPNKPPHYKTNVKIVCDTCNGQKGDMTPEEYAAYLATQAEYDENQRELKRRWLFDWKK
jgi:hypothetical protein